MKECDIRLQKEPKPQELMNKNYEWGKKMVAEGKGRAPPTDEAT